MFDGESAQILKEFGVDESTAADISLFEIPEVVESLNDAAVCIRSQIDGLPQLSETLQFEAYGYHGGYLPALDKLPAKPRWQLKLWFWSYFSLSQIVLVPSVDHRFGRQGSYGFPKRFRISSINEEGDADVIREWMDEDFPNPGRIPVVIDIPQEDVHIIQIDVFRGADDGGREVLALDEVYGVNGVGSHACKYVYASLSFESPPYWGEEFLVDQRTSLGLPVDYRGKPPADERIRDFVARFPSGPANRCIVELDLGENRKLGWVTLYPSQPQDGILIPGYGFPKRICLELIAETESGERGAPVHPEGGEISVSPGNNIVRVAGSACTGRWVRLYFDELPIHDSQPTFALGEIMVQRLDETYPVRGVQLERFPEGLDCDPQLLVDGCSGGYPCLNLLDWVKKIHRRDQLSKGLVKLQASSETLVLRHQRLWRIILFGLLALIAVAAVVTAVAEYFLRLGAARKIRHQISSDLHDDVGSTLGSISMSAEQLGKMELGETAAEIIGDLSLMSREACASLREVIWVADKTKTYLPELVRKLAERAERVLDGVELDISISEGIPDVVVSLNTKRHLIMFYKEALHNCIRHAEATRVSVFIVLKDQWLTVSVRDNGCGFDLSKSSAGWGLSTMKKRARELRGEVTVTSAVGSGTTVELRVPVKALSADPRRAYKTSN